MRIAGGADKLRLSAFFIPFVHSNRHGQTIPVRRFLLKRFM
ncbi:MAG: hypothetical protein JETT_2098 [Candidatus Jettenia ecosi]|uniref:Uncharacterized protein n=1 Tax=Candidatus Jettenia ecosi TaxID=2494326 RepID=A0A533QG33_9BACT|nr:MAG: hypothetical protein JETT_2098 [Candidatus Jettenia ecosi]